MALHIIRFSLLILFGLAAVARADVAPLFSGTAQPLFGRSDATGAVASGSLFAGTQSGSLFEPFPDRRAPITPRGSGVSNAIADLLTLIARAEAGQRGYDAVQHGARIGTPRPPTQLTLGEIYAWIDATPGQPHAIGRYQFIPPTLRRVAQIRGYGPEVRFTPAVQDALALVLLEDADLREFEAGTLGRHTFMHNLARIWAGLPLPNGNSYYEGYAGNRASMTWAEFEGGVARIWPAG